jgi:hypothetical protein
MPILMPGTASAAGYGTFAECVRNSGAVIYEADWCPVCRAQRKEFRGYANRLKFVDCSIPGSKKTRGKCKALGVDSFPTWIFRDGTKRSGYLKVSAIATFTGCALPD